MLPYNLFKDHSLLLLSSGTSSGGETLLQSVLGIALVGIVAMTTWLSSETGMTDGEVCTGLDSELAPTLPLSKKLK